MDLLTKEELRTLMEEHEAPCVSIYMPTHRAGREILQDPTRLKNLLASAEEQLIAQGVRAPVARKWLEPAQALREDQRFWQHQSDGLAVFISGEFFKVYHFPLEFDDLVIVSPHFYIKPLLPLLSGDGTFYILALSQNQVRFFQGSRFSVTEVALEETEIPENLAEALQYDEPLKQQQFHTETPNIRGERPAIFHGQGAGHDDENENLLRFFQAIDKGVQALLQNEQAPLVLVGVEHLLPIYREANSYPHLFEEGVHGNVEHLRPEEIHAQAWAIIQTHFAQLRQDSLAQYRDLLHTEQASDDLQVIIPAAFYGRVETLFVDIDHQVWGNFDPEANQVRLHQEAKQGDEDLIDVAAIQTLLNGGAVFTVEPENAAAEVPVVAIFRYSLPEQAQRAS